jgi:hypothetical protein
MLRFQFPVPRLLASGAGTLIRATRTCSGFVYLALSDLCPYNSDRDTRLHATGYYVNQLPMILAYLSAIFG